jgi:hypothetical protein
MEITHYILFIIYYILCKEKLNSIFKKFFLALLILDNAWKEYKRFSTENYWSNENIIITSLENTMHYGKLLPKQVVLKFRVKIN